MPVARISTATHLNNTTNGLVLVAAPGAGGGKGPSVLYLDWVKASFLMSAAATPVITFGDDTNATIFKEAANAAGTTAPGVFDLNWVCLDNAKPGSAGANPRFTSSGGTPVQIELQVGYHYGV